jgi:hypothetical protein
MMGGKVAANVCLEAFMATEFSKIILGCQPESILLNDKEQLSLLAFV